MYPARVMVAIGLVGLAGCSLISKGKSKVGGDSSMPEAPSAGDAPSPDGESEERDYDGERAMERLDRLEEALRTGAWDDYLRQSDEFQGMINDDYKDYRNHDALAKRGDDLDNQAVKKIGGKVAANIPNATRIYEGVDEVALDAVQAMLTACGDLESAITHEMQYDRHDAETAAAKKKAGAAYDAQLAKAKKADAKAFRYRGKIGQERVDVPTAWMSCELSLRSTAGAAEDEYVAEERANDVKNVKHCAEVEWLAGGVQIGSNKFAPYARVQGGTQGTEPMDCKKFPKKDSYPPALKGAVHEFLDRERLTKAVTVTRNKPYFETEDDLKVYRYQLMATYSPDFEKGGNPCGPEPKLFCESGGSQLAGSYNKAEFFLSRAAAHAGKDKDKCKKFLQDVVRSAAGAPEFKAAAEKDKSWVAGGTYKLKNGKKLKEKDFLAAYAAMGQKAQDRLDNKYCAEPQATP